MTNNRDGHPDAAGAHTGTSTPDPKDAHQVVYTTTPADDRVSSADEGKYEPVAVPSAKEVTGQFDHLATRDVSAMEHAPQAPEFAGAESVAGLGGEHLDTIIPSAGVGVDASSATAMETRLTTSPDQNPAYTPPSEQGPPHVSQRPGDLPQGETPELEHEVMGDADRGY